MNKREKNVLNIQIPRNHWVLPSALRNSKCQIEFAFDTIPSWRDFSLFRSNTWNRKKEICCVFFSFLYSVIPCYVMEKVLVQCFNKSVSIAIETTNDCLNGNCRWENKELKYKMCLNWNYEICE